MSRLIDGPDTIAGSLIHELRSYFAGVAVALCAACISEGSAFFAACFTCLLALTFFACTFLAGLAFVVASVVCAAGVDAAGADAAFDAGAAF